MLQRISLLIEDVQKYLGYGRMARFVFVGSRVYLESIASLYGMFPKNVFYCGKITVVEAASIKFCSNQSMLPIVDDFCRYAVSSQSSTYALSDTNIFCISGAHTNVAKWVMGNGLGRVVSPDVENLLSLLTATDMGFLEPHSHKDEIKKYHVTNYSENNFVTNIQNIFSNQMTV